MYEAAHPDRPTESAGQRAGNLDDTGFRVDISDQEGGVRVALLGELDLASAPELQRELLALIARPVTGLTLDLSGLTFLDSSGLGALYRARQAADERHIALRLEAVPEHVMRVLDVTAMAPLFDLEVPRG